MLQESSEFKCVADHMTLREFMDEARGIISANVLKMAGYESCAIGPNTDSIVAMIWCANQCGDEYTTDGHRFWFNSKEDLVMFKLLYS